MAPAIEALDFQVATTDPRVDRHGADACQPRSSRAVSQVSPSAEALPSAQKAPYLPRPAQEPLEPTVSSKGWGAVSTEHSSIQRATTEKVARYSSASC